MKTEVNDDTFQKIKEIREARKKQGRADWNSKHILAELVNKLHKKECK